MSSSSKKKVRRAFGYVRRFGIWRGVSLWKALSDQPGSVQVRLPGSREPLRLRTGTSDRQAFDHVFYKSYYDIPLPITPRLIIDAGANVGYASVDFAQRYPEAEILAVEPESSNFAVLEENVRPYPNVKPIRAGLWHRDMRLRIRPGNDLHWSFRVEPAEDSDPNGFDAITLDTLLEMASAPRIDLLKLDIEGSEKEVFEHAGPWLQQTQVMIIELHDRFRNGCQSALEHALEGQAWDRSQKGENVILVRSEAPSPGVSPAPKA